MIHQVTWSLSPDHAIPSLPSLGTRIPVRFLRTVKNSRGQQEMSHTRKAAGHVASPLHQLFHLTILKFWRLPWTFISLPGSWQTQNLTGFCSYLYPAYNFLGVSGKRRSFGVGLLLESQFYHSSWLCVNNSNFLNLCFSICNVETIISTFKTVESHMG